MKSTKKRWTKVAKISVDENISLDKHNTSISSIGSSNATLRTNLSKGSGWLDGSFRGTRSPLGLSTDGTPHPAELAGYSLDDFIDTVRAVSDSVHETDKKGASVAHYLAMKGRKDLLEHALICGADFKAQDSSGDTPLHWAVRGNSSDALHCLVYAGADLSELNNHKMTPLHLACQLNLPDMVEAICSHDKIDVNLPGEYGQTPLHYCALSDSLEAAQILLKFKARLCIRDNNGVYVIHCAATHASRKVLQLLLDQAEAAGYTRDIVLKMKDKENNTALHSAVNSGSEEAVRVCIEFGSPIDVLQEDDSTPLHLAASQGSLPLVKLLLSPPASDTTLSNCDVELMTPLHRAAMFDHVDVADFLIEKGADVDSVDKTGCSPLLRAVSRGSINTAKLLIGKYGADCNLLDCSNRNILHLAVQSGKNLKAYGLVASEKAIHVLLNNVDSSGCTPIHYATRDGNIQSLQSLIELGATVNLKNNQKQSPLHFAARYGRYNSCRRLLDSAIGPNIINDVDGAGMTALHIASLSGHSKVISMLILRGALLHRDYKGRTPLHLAAMGGYLDSVQTLLNTHRYLLDQVDDNGDTAMQLAAKENQPSSVDFLLTAGADLILNNDKLGLMSVVIGCNNEDVAMAIISHDRGEEAFAMFVRSDREALRKLIGKMPLVYKKMLDRSVTTSADTPTSPDYWVLYEFKFLQLPLEERIKNKKDGFPTNPLCALNMAVEHDQMGILSHPVCLEYLNHKWKSYGLLIHFTGTTIYLAFLACLTFLAINCSSNTHANETTSNVTMEATDEPNPTMECMMTISVYIATGFCVLSVLKEFAQMCHERFRYFIDWNNYLEWGLYTSTLLFVIPFLLGSDFNDMSDMQRQSGAFAAFLGWFVMLLLEQRIEVIGIYVVMFQVILTTLVQVLAVFLGLIIAFAMAFFVLLKDEENKAFESVPISIFRVFAMTLAEIDFINSFVYPAMDSDDQTMPYPETTYFFLALLLIFLTIILMNLMIGLAVGDIASVQQDAKLKNLAKQVELYTEMEGKIPARILEYVNKDYVVNFSNIRCKLKRSKARKLWKEVRNGKCDKTSKSGDHMMSCVKGLPIKKDNNNKNTEMTSITKKMTSLSSQLEKQSDILRLIMQKMDINTEADQDEGVSPSADGVANPRFDFRQVVSAAQRNQPRIKSASATGHPGKSV
ncbi:transient receptor potential cation channel subfamily A member 1-like [Asterias rubens]|uniref:transient receptor potential cation channel subfamily A member 1-like n=1 Tax=Asterias rubens TaxID=7604 RepID=UPI001455A24A|nr:transient receptor potential cation channel subfamily A member 1-like [Asterias rubens]